MMNYSEFRSAFHKVLLIEFGDDYDINLTTVKKPNVGEMEAYNIVKGDVGAVVYVKNVYESYVQGRSIDEIAKNIASGIREMDMVQSAFTDFTADEVYNKVYYKMVGINGNEEYLKDLPYIVPAGFDDIALVPTIPVTVPGPNQTGSVKVTYSMMKSLDLDPEKLHACAELNTEQMVRILPMSAVLFSGDPFTVPADEWKTTRSDFMFVAIGDRDASVLGAPRLMNEVYEIKGDHFIIPSSTHEIIFATGQIQEDIGYLKGMVSAVNGTLSPEDVLTDSVYECRNGQVITHRGSSEQTGASGAAGAAGNDFLASLLNPKDEGLASYGGPKL